MGRQRHEKDEIVSKRHSRGVTDSPSQSVSFFAVPPRSTHHRLKGRLRSPRSTQVLSVRSLGLLNFAPPSLRPRVLTLTVISLSSLSQFVRSLSVCASPFPAPPRRRLPRRPPERPPRPLPALPRASATPATAGVTAAVSASSGALAASHLSMATAAVASAAGDGGPSGASPALMPAAPLPPLERPRWERSVGTPLERPPVRTRTTLQAGAFEGAVVGAVAR